MADPDPSRPDLLLRVEQAQAQSHALQELVAELAEAVAQVELDVARVHEGIAEQGGSLAAQAREHAKRAREVAAREYAEAVRLRGVGAGWDRWPEGAASASKSSAQLVDSSVSGATSPTRTAGTEHASRSMAGSGVGTDRSGPRVSGGSCPRYAPSAIPQRAQEPARRTTGRAGWCWLLALEQSHVGGLGAFRPWRHVELDGLALIK